ncbi:molecular chaperone HtpG [Thermoflavifilum thermophilum]|uniref:Chaperone protein HtpG n=1 Tax=Thermoflavifilum thermophilum TaxID=1393122 RepID=A0A1I7N4Y3_9BACT|nr:molecular chaperone HtpG [Thermoflavifilum thermophilum]SFV29636.1 molecular chaperone HtpG [Thermoflavifilum thermophilum]
MQKGQIRVHTENIFPIIKKFLYSEHEIFLRELISNAVDATQKLKMLANSGEFKGELGTLDIEVKLDAAKRTITISDRGIGMTAEEVDRYINQVAFSSAEEFLSKYKGDGASIIGHFGLGFYSAFMVSERVEIVTRSYREGAQAVRWVCDGSPEFTLEEAERPWRGTDVILHLYEDSLEFLEPERIRAILLKYCRFLPVPIYFEGKQINNTEPIWIKRPSELTSQDYQKFYKELYPHYDPPLFWIHLHVDYPFHLNGVLYFPKISRNFDIQKDRISLYCNQVFVTDEVKDIVPEFLMLLHGVIDSPDIPLNVSRSYLQGDPNVRKINSHITKKVADKLEEIFKQDRKELEEKWEYIGLFVKYGMMTDDKFRERAQAFLLMQDAFSTSTWYTLAEYREKAAPLQTNQDQKLVILYTTDVDQQYSYLQAARDRGYVVVKLDSIIDAAFIQSMEEKWEDVVFTRVDADIPERLVKRDESSHSVLTAQQEARLKELFAKEVPNPAYRVELKGLSPETQPVVATRPEMNRRLKEMASMSGQAASWYGRIPDELVLTVNTNHPIYQQILQEQNEEQQRKMIRNLADLALLSQQMLSGEALNQFIQRSIELMSGIKKSSIILPS